MNKQEIRTLIKQRKKQHTTEELSALSLPPTRSLLERIQAEEDVHTILLYHSMPDEVNTHDLVRSLHRLGKQILLPTVVGDNLELHEYLGDSTLATGISYGIQESTGPLFTHYGDIHLAVIPGVAFTPQGDRLGRGRGYYDRLLPHLSCPLIGLAFPFQILDALPCEPHDIRMDAVIY